MREPFQGIEAGELLSLRIRSDPSATRPSDKNFFNYSKSKKL